MRRHLIPRRSGKRMASTWRDSDGLMSCQTLTMTINGFCFGVGLCDGCEGKKEHRR